MTRKERKAINQRVAARERLRQFYRSYKYYIDESIKFVDKEVKARLLEIEKLFSMGHDAKNKSDRDKRFLVPVTYSSYLEMKSQKILWPYLANRQFRKALREVERTHQRQWYRNLEILTMLKDHAVQYLQITKKNQYLKAICKAKGEAGEQASIFRNARLEDAKVLIGDCKELISIIRTNAFINDIDHYIKTYRNFFVQCQARLDKFYESLTNLLYDKKEIPSKTESTNYLKSRELDLELPGWEELSKTEKALEQ